LNRHALRGLIVQTLYHMEIGLNTNNESEAKVAAVDSISDYVALLKEKAVKDPEINLTEDILETEFTIDAFYYTTLEGVIKNITKIDSLISENLEGWNLTRLNKVDKAILRLAVYELLEKSAPKKIIINEAIELSKNFTDLGDKKSPNFNNRLLDKIANQLEHNA